MAREPPAESTKRQQRSLRSIKGLGSVAANAWQEYPASAERNQSRVTGLGNSSRTTLGEALRNQRAVLETRWNPLRIPAIPHRNGCTSRCRCEAAKARLSHTPQPS